MHSSFGDADGLLPTASSGSDLGGALPSTFLMDTPLPKSFEEAAMQIAACPAPPEYAKPPWPRQRMETLVKQCMDYVRRAEVASDEDYQGALAIALWTTESPVYRYINMWCNTRGRRTDQFSNLLPFMRLLGDALTRPALCRKYTGPAVRILRADSTSPQLMRDAYDNYQKHFAVDQPVNFRGFASFARVAESVEPLVGNDDPAILIVCSNLVAYDIDDWSMIKRTDNVSETELLCQAPSFFKVSDVPSKCRKVVTVHVSYDAEKSDLHAYVLPHLEATCMDACADLSASAAPLLGPNCIENGAASGTSDTMKPMVAANAANAASPVVDCSVHLSNACAVGIAANVAPNSSLTGCSSTPDPVLPALGGFATGPVGMVSSLTVDASDSEELVFNKLLPVKSAIQLIVSNNNSFESFGQLWDASSTTLVRPITSVDLSGMSAVTSIGGYFLHSCKGLRCVDLSPLSQVTAIGHFFLSNCSGLGTIDLKPLTLVKTVGHGFLLNCAMLNGVDLSVMRSLEGALGGSLLEGCSAAAAVSFPRTLRATDTASFLRQCSCLGAVDLFPFQDVTSVGTYFLDGCKALTSIDLSSLSHVQMVGSCFLQGCEALRSIDLAPLNQATSVGDYFLQSCSGLTSVDLSPFAQVRVIGINFLHGCTAISRVDLSPLRSVNCVGSGFMHNCSALADEGLLSGEWLKRFRE